MAAKRVAESALAGHSTEDVAERRLQWYRKVLPMKKQIKKSNQFQFATDNPMTDSNIHYSYFGSFLLW